MRTSSGFKHFDLDVCCSPSNFEQIRPSQSKPKTCLCLLAGLAVWLGAAPLVLLLPISVQTLKQESYKVGEHGVVLEAGL